MIIRDLGLIVQLLSARIGWQCRKLIFGGLCLACLKCRLHKKYWLRFYELVPHETWNPYVVPSYISDIFQRNILRMPLTSSQERQLMAWSKKSKRNWIIFQKNKRYELLDTKDHIPLKDWIMIQYNRQRPAASRLDMPDDLLPDN